MPGRERREKRHPGPSTCAHNDGIVAALWQGVRRVRALQRLGLPADGAGSRVGVNGRAGAGLQHSDVQIGHSLERTLEQKTAAHSRSDGCSAQQQLVLLHAFNARHGWQRHDGHRRSDCEDQALR